PYGESGADLIVVRDSGTFRPHPRFAAHGTKQTCLPRRSMSAFGGRADPERRQGPWHKPAYLSIVFSRSFHPEGENHEDASCCRHSCDGARSPRSGEGEAGAIDASAIGTPARLSVVGATRLLPRLPSE